MKSLLATISQLNRNLLLRTSPRGGVSRYLGGAAYRLECFLRRFGDPLITYRIGERILRLPLSHALPMIRRMWPRYTENLVVIAGEVWSKYPNCTGIDVGANIGDTVALVRTCCPMPFLCIEGDPKFVELCIANTRPMGNVQVVHTLLGDKDETTDLHWRSADGTAGLVKNTSGGEPKSAIRTLDRVLGEYERFQQSHLLKIDTDGFDCHIMRGATEMLQQAAPVLFFEYDPVLLAQCHDDGLSIFEYLHSLGYGSMILFDNFGGYLKRLSANDLGSMRKIHGDLAGKATGHYNYVDVAVFSNQDSDIADAVEQHYTR